MNEEKFCNLYNGFFGEDIDSVKQLSFIKFSGPELMEFLDHVLTTEANKALPLLEALEKILKDYNETEFKFQYEGIECANRLAEIAQQAIANYKNQ